MIKRRTRRGIILLALLAVLSWLLSRPSAEGPASSLSELDTRLNYALYDFSGRMLDDQGRIQLEIESPVLRNDAESGVGTVETPQLRIQQGDDRWYITAESAQVTADRELVSLRGDVVLVRRNDATGQQLDISTRDVLLNVTPRTASTQAAVRIEQSGDRLDAKGMKLDMIANHFELLDDVQAYYEVP
jgi:LPS export ABC transporter protein LptC